MVLVLVFSQLFVHLGRPSLSRSLRPVRSGLDWTGHCTVEDRFEFQLKELGLDLFLVAIRQLARSFACSINFSVGLVAGLTSVFVLHSDYLPIEIWSKNKKDQNRAAAASTAVQPAN